jgi:hypothetical protein
MKRKPHNLWLAALALGVACIASDALAAAQPKGKAAEVVPLPPLPQIPKSVFEGKGRNPFAPFGSDRPVSPTQTLTTISVSDATLRQFEAAAQYGGSVIQAGQSWALINGRQFFLNTPMLLDPNRPDFNNLRVQATLIEEDRVVLMLLDGTRRTITIKRKQP